jgi:hypothetical protein
MEGISVGVGIEMFMTPIESFSGGAAEADW